MFLEMHKKILKTDKGNIKIKNKKSFMLIFFNYYLFCESHYIFFLIGIVESSLVHSALRPPMAYCARPRVIMMMEKFVE
jgi:hypothetical protein